MTTVVIVDFENDFEEQAVYIDGEQYDRIDSNMYVKALERLDDLGVIHFEQRILDTEVAKRFRGKDRYQPLEAFDVVEREIALEKAAELRRQAAELEARARELDAQATATVNPNPSERLG